jgi:multidrug resistance protein
VSRALALVCLAAFLSLLGLSVLFPVLPFFVRSLGLDAFDQGLLMSAYALASFATGPLWGRFSERFGRKPALLVGLGGFSLAFFLFALGESLAELVLARTLGGLLAGATQPAILAYVADVSAPERRSVAMGQVGAAFGLGIVAGPVLGGALAPLGLRVPFFTTAAIGLAAFVAVALLLPESLPSSARVGAAAERRSGGASLGAAARALAPFLAVGFLVQTGRTALESTLGFLVLDRVGGDARGVGLVLGAGGLLSVLVQGGAMRPLAHRYRDRSLLLAGTALLGCGLGALALARGWSSVFAATALVTVGSALQTPTFNAELSRAAAGGQGEAQGLLASAQSLGRVLGPLLFTGLYEVEPGLLPYGVAALTVAAALALSVRLRA